ncbi:hypothetical protein QQ008_01505 [Fulvivirgaceae bacterium BMA10]|uniref:G-D-S-L family lipolytic protein n=1 Tax=Splendidivirga corallicola TaxID=3051826 RepID=A0ABT8KH11_9BACT|nr:hypothetical protein [Fulvivirgaceae bacterium BMA10]
MKRNKFIYISFICLLVLWSCEQEFKVIQPATPTPPDPEVPSAGSADFTKFIAIGNSLTAGFQAAALFNEGQQTSLGAILNKQFEAVGAGTFNQPDINSENGFNASFSDLSDPLNPVILGRLILAGDPPAPTPTSSDLNAVPDPTINPGFVYSGETSQLNNFGVPGILLGQALIPETGNWTLAGTDPRFNPYYARFASNPGVSTILTDALSAQGTFFLFWLGNNDVLGYATTGGSGAVPLTDPTSFAFQYQTAITAITTDPNIKGVVGNIPDVTSIPFFTLVPYNAIPMDETTATLSNGAYTSYNDGLAGAAQFMIIDQAEMDKRTISFAAGNNAIVIEDETLSDISLPDGQGGTIELPKIRQATANDLILLPASALLGTLADPNNPATVYGVGVALADNLVLIEDEVQEIKDAITAFNTTIKGIADGSDRIAYADVNKTLADLATAGVDSQNGISITPSLVPPTGVFSEDAVHPNSRGYAVAANTFIEAINQEFGANVLKVNIGNYKGTGLPQ